jgi:hypothetical protein
MNDEEDTNPKHRSRSRPRSDIPAEYLIGEPSPEGHILTEQCGQHDGAPVPFWMFSEVAIRLGHEAHWRRDIDGLRRKGTRLVIACVSTLALNFVPFIIYMQHRSEESGAERERAAAIQRAFDEYRTGIRLELQGLHDDIRELRRDLRRMSGGTPDSTLLSPPPDQISWRLP